MKWVKGFILWAWQLPQNLLAFCIEGIMQPLCRQGGSFEGKELIYSKYFLSSFSLGNTIFAVPNTTFRVLRHELGHCRQSEILGPLYIPVIAIPSVLNNIYCRIIRKLGKSCNYYNFYTEKWADNLGNVGLSFKLDKSSDV